MKEAQKESARFQMNPRREMLGFAHREVARNHENSFFFTQLSLFIKINKSPILLQKSREIAMKESSLGAKNIAQRNSHCLIIVCGPEKERSILYSQ